MAEEFVRITVSTLKNVNDAVAPFLPFVGAITSLTKEIADAYENVQYNKKTCGTLVNRVEAAEAAIKRLMRQKEENIEKFCNQDYYNTFSKFVNCLKKIKEFFYDISQLSKFRKFYTSGNIKEKLQEIIKEFDGYSIDLNLAISIATNDQLNKDLQILHSDMIEMMKFLSNVEGGVTSIDNNIEKVSNDVTEIQIQNEDIITIINNIEEQNNKIIEQNNRIIEYESKHKSLDFTPLNTEIESICILSKDVNSQNPRLGVKARRIDPSEIKDTHQYVKPRKGSRVLIQKKIYKQIDVACKPISMDNIQKIQKHLAILKKLEACPYIIQFHGLSEINKEQVMVFEWAEYGTLRDLYNAYNIQWEAKVSIARNICRGLIFLHTVEILHHDVRCENVLITENMQPKICNFKFSREFNAATILIDDLNDIIHWLAPEKLSHLPSEKDPKKVNKKQNEASYTIQCDIFSFAMLLWELGFQKKPYDKWSISQIQKYVLKGNREKLDFGLSPSPIQKEYHTIIELAWEQEPSLRPGIQHIFNMLQQLYEKYVLQRGSPSLQPKINEFDESTQSLTIPNLNREVKTSYISKVTPLTPLKEGLLAHKEKNYEEAWKCFEEHAKVGDSLAKYWQGYYYLEGRYVEKNHKKAKELFKESADGGNADAQLRYAFCLIDKENENAVDYSNFLKYLQMSADKQNATALYNLGEIYLQGKMGVKEDKDKGFQYLKLAALRRQPKAIEILEEQNINLY